LKIVAKSYEHFGVVTKAMLEGKQSMVQLLQKVEATKRRAQDLPSKQRAAIEARIDKYTRAKKRIGSQAGRISRIVE
jgi:hypothetical protein